MKHALRSSLHAWLIAVLLVPATLNHAADAAPAPDYQTLVNGLFDQAAGCEIRGCHTVLQRHWIEFATPDAQSLQKLRQIFLLETPQYLGTDIPPSLDLTNPLLSFQFIWLDQHGKQLGYLDLLEGDKLIFNGTHLFTNSTPKGKNVALEQHAADFTSPEIAAERKQPKPDYHAMIKAIFAKAASCKIEGEYYGRESMNAPTHEVDFTTSDARELLELQDIFLREKPRFFLNLRNSKTSVGANSSCNLYFTWRDAQGETLSRVLLAGDNVYFVETHDLFNTTPENFGRGNGNLTLQKYTGRFALPKIYGKTGQSVKSGGVK
jgi:hypothetical protein